MTTATRRVRKTKLMLKIEDLKGESLERLIPRIINEIGMSAAADELTISKATLGYWCLKLGVRCRYIALAPGETIEIKRGV